MPDPEPVQQDDTSFSKIALSESDVREAARLLRVFARAIGNQASGDDRQQLARDDLIERARIILDSRRTRALFFSPSMFGEPAWDIMLALYTTEGRHPLGRLAEWAETPPSTAVRWIEYLEKKLLVEREPHPNDKRIVFVKLSKKGRKLLDDYLSSTRWDPDDVGGV
jgi:DNA-binding MarR family transcriptional regulator